MQLLSKLLSIIFSTRLTGVLLIVFAFSMATATFIENDYGTETSKALVYSAKWFEILIILLAINFMGNIAKYNLFSWEKAPVFLLHFAFIVIIIGSGITRYRGYEALVTIKENESKNQILSIDSFLQLQINDNHIAKNFTPKALMMSQLGFNYLNESYRFEDKKVNVSLKEYIPRASYVLEPSKTEKAYLHIVIAEDSQRKDFYIEKGTRENLFGIGISFDYPNPLISDIKIFKKKESLYALFPETTNYFSMAENKAGFYAEDSLVPLKFKALSTINEVPIVFNSFEENKIKKLIQKPIDKSVKNPESALVLEVTSGEETKEVVLLGGKGYYNPSTTLFINDLHLKMNYGSKAIQLPFNIQLDDFKLERYPGSDSPSAYYSDLQIIDGDIHEKHQIFMNNVLDYKGYRFFQSAYLPDESGTILSVNHDKWGTLVTYIGYSLLTLGMLLSLIWNKKTVSFTPKQKLI